MTTTADLDATETRLLMDIKRDDFGDPGLTITGRPVIVQPRMQTIRNISTDDWRPHPLADFIVRGRALVDPSSLGDTYGWHRGYHDVYQVDTDLAAVMLKHLRRVDRGMQRIEADLGPARDLAAYIARVANVCKIRSFGWKVADGGPSWTYDGNAYAWSDATGLMMWVERQIAEFRQWVTA